VGNDGSSIAPIMYKVKIASPSSAHWTVGVDPVGVGQIVPSVWNGMYLQVIEGTGKGKYRKIESMLVDFDVDTDSE
jgi:hypothetical protein